MRKLSLSTWLLIGSAAVLALAAVVLFLTPQETWTELRTLHDRYGYAKDWGPAPDYADGPPFQRPGYGFRGPRVHGHFPVVLLLIFGVLFITGRFFRLRRRSDVSLSILEELFAEGKIDEAEFIRRRSVLNGSPRKED
jgi:uncharacterized membrane protein